ncbi:hypothetical protein EYR38_010592 [Pleurotus pulmonarius]|nr:hypothetical protein EYR38_010592 [Pleurotus pulmonarius]
MDSSIMDVDETIVAERDTPTYDDDDDPLVRYNAEINSKILDALRPLEGVLTLPFECWSDMARTLLRKIFDVVSGYPGSLISPSLLSDFEMQMIPERFHPKLIQTLYEAWQAKDFKRLRNLQFLRELEVPTTDKNQTLLHESFNLPYIGNVPEHLLSVIDSMKNNVQSHAPILSMIQSSGMGKTRALYEIGKKRIVIHCCLGKDDADATSYPPPDVALRDYLLKAPSPQDNEGSCKVHIQAMFYSLFKSVLAVINLVKKDNGISHDALVRYFRRFRSSDNRRILLDDTQDITPASYLAIQNHFETLFNNPLERRAFYDFVRYNIPAPAWFTVKELTQASLSMFKAVRKQVGYNQFPIILALDDVHVLFNDERLSREHSIYSRLISVLADIGQYIGTVVVSTSLAVPLVKPSKEIASSARERAAEFFLPAPYTELSFDVHCRCQPLSKNLSLNDIGTLKQVSIFGRPLWQSMVISHFDMELHGEAVQSILSTVIRKLIGQQFSTSLPNEMNAPALAILCTRILLDLSPTISPAQDLIQDLIRSHLRVVYSIHEDREAIISGSSSEPLVAEAAAIVMNSDWSDREPMAVWRILAEYVSQGLMGQGDAGALLGRTISIMAMDRAISGCPRRAELKYQTPIEVNKYFQALLTHEQWEALRTSVPANFSKLREEDSTRSFEDAFRGAYVHFSHYSRAGDSSPLNIDYLWALWTRGVATQCQPTQEYTGRVLPMYFASHGTIQPASMSCILEQDRTSPNLNPSSVVTPCAEVLDIFGGGVQMPYITILNCYAGSSSPAGQTSRYTQLEDTRRPEQNEEAPRYEIVLHSLDAYKDLGTHTECIAAIINGSTSFLFEHHPRKTPTSLSLLHALQPFLDDDASTTQWFEH